MQTQQEIITATLALGADGLKALGAALVEARVRRIKAQAILESE